MSNFVLQFRLKTQPYEEDILNKRFEIGRRMYNSLVNVTQKRYKEMIEDEKYRDLISSFTGDEQHDKVIWKQIGDKRKQCGLYEYAFHEDIKKIRRRFKKDIDMRTAQKIASSLWQAYDKLFFGNGNKIHFKRYGELNSLEGKSNKAGIRFKYKKEGDRQKFRLLWNRLEIPVLIDNNYYEKQALQCDIAYCRIVRKLIKHKYHYYVQIVFKGIPPVKINKETGEIKHSIGAGDVGIDIGTSTIAIASESDVKILELADKVQNIEKEKRRLLRKMDRSRRATNPDNYNEDGTIKQQGSKKVVWNKSNHYINYQNLLLELCRKQADVRKYQHECLANYVISLGNNVFVEHMNFAGLKKRSTKTEISEKTGKYKKKKRFGKSIANRAPSMLITIIDRKLKYFDTKLIEINTRKAKASQFNHFDGVYNKKTLSQRWNDFDGIKVQRDMYSAFLIMNVNSDLESFNIEKCNERFDNFKRLHDIEVQRLKNKKNLSSIAI